MKKVTFAIPAYNHASYIRETLDSIWEDDYPFKEIVIIDDGSSDDTAIVIREWCNKKEWRGIVFSSRPNKGITATLNELLSISTGDYIRLFSSDDLLELGSTKKMARILEADDKLMAVFGDVAVIDINGVTISQSALETNGANKTKLLNANFIAEEIISNWSVSGPAILIKKLFFEKFEKYDETMLVDDWDLYCRLVSRASLRFIDSRVAKYRIHGENVSKTRNNKKRIKNLLSQASVVDKNIDLFDGRVKLLFFAEKNLLLAKASYLSLRLVRCGLYLFKYIVYKFKASL